MSLLPFCRSEAQRRVVRAVAEHKSIRAAALALGQDHSTVLRTLKRVKLAASQAGHHPPTHDTHPVAPGYVVRGTSKLYKAGEEEPVLTWVKTRQDDQHRLDALRAALDEITILAKGACGEAPAPAGDSYGGDLLAVYPLGDAHIGMLSWGQETGEDWDLRIADEAIRKAAASVVRAAPNAEQALLIVLGDYFHTDDSTDATPAHGHKLDADSRYAKRVKVGIDLLRHLIDQLRQKHRGVTVWIRQGNHDPHATVMLRSAIAALFASDPRVAVSEEPGQFDVLRWGSCLIGATHGHTVKAGKLPLLLAARFPEAWGLTKWRHWYTGHTHHDYSESFPGCTVEQVRIIAPGDAYAHGAGYDADRGLHVDTWHFTRGRIARYTEVVG